MVTDVIAPGRPRLSALPAFIDNDYDDADQVIENLQRENMTPRESAGYVGRALAKGRKKKEIAARSLVGISSTHHCSGQYWSVSLVETDQLE